MTDHLVSQFTWLGDKNFKSFGNTRVSNVFFVAATRCSWFLGPRDKNEFKTEMKKFLRATKQRYRYSSKKSKSSTQTIDKEEMTLEEIEDKLNQLLEDKEESEDYDGDQENFEASGEDFEDDL